MSTVVMSRATRRRWWWFLWGLLAVLAIGIAAYFVTPYLTGSSTVPIDRSIPGYYVSLVIHAAPAGLALIIGPWQFVPRLRARFPRLHRVLGRVYLVSVVAAALAASYSAAVTPSGFPLQVAFYMLVVAWLYSAAQAYRTIRRREVQLHRIWMIRNYTLTFAAVTLRLYLLLGVQLMNVIPSLEYRDVYTSSAWASLLGNVLVAEYFIIQRMLAPLARGKRRSDATVAESPQPVGQDH
ncbi:DUF2306 domain-containing protein [Kutzneria albida]|uniref:DUF2306 domain-containing protein n=1 Tax=Kutzneria albida DSM 43870 TaxID=1449976 RepID=W5WAM8_9PSEU|nr:DUF2306 domain-containing protein [Kutzneria albida]AHH95249.1 hypothetical protein KALB_1879 [Kutzneria albida DSM 43870]